MRIHLKQGYKHPHYTTTRKAVKKSETLLMPSRNDREISGRINYVLGNRGAFCLRMCELFWNNWILPPLFTLERAVAVLARWSDRIVADVMDRDERK